MKKQLLLMAFGLVCMMSASAQYTLRTLTFEDEDYAGTQANYLGYYNWSSLIDSPQYGGTLLYGANHGDTTQVYTSTNYKWYDQGNTYLYHELPENYGVTMYWGGGHAISNYWNGILNDGDYLHQLSVYVPDSINSNGQGGQGHNGSDNFCVHFGYSDDSGYSTSNLPCIYFYDGVERTIDHMYINNTTYFANCVVNGNDLTGNLAANEYVRVKATGYDVSGNVVGSTTKNLAYGTSYISSWKKWSLATLGNVYKVEFNIESNCDNGYGMSQPAYFAYDDVAVRFATVESRKMPAKRAEAGEVKTMRITSLPSNQLSGDIPEGVTLLVDAPNSNAPLSLSDGEELCCTIKGMPSNAKITGISVYGMTDGIIGQSKNEAYIGDNMFASLNFCGIAVDEEGYYKSEFDEEEEMEMNMETQPYCTDNLYIKSYGVAEQTDIVYFDIDYVIDETPTSIEDTIATIKSAECYSLQGVRVSQPNKSGIYVKNGKKILVK